MRRLVLLAALLAAGLAVAGCGPAEEIVTEGDTEGIYLDVGELKYQVQISRQLNPADVEDRGWFVGVPPADRRLDANEVWFGVFLRVENETDRPLPTAEEFEIVDTRGEVYRPVPLPETNVFRYEPRMLSVDGLIPDPDSAAFYSAPGGALLLFRMGRPALENRPLELIVRPPSGGDEGTIELDV